MQTSQTSIKTAIERGSRNYSLPCIKWSDSDLKKILSL